MYLVGKIIGTHGIKGELKIHAETNFSRFEIGNVLHIKKENEYQELKVKTHRMHKNNHLVSFEGYTNINEVLSWIGLNLFTTHDPDELQIGEYYYEDLIGKTLLSTKGEILGKVIDIREVPQGIILEGKNDKKTFLIPFVDEFVKEITTDKIVIEVMEGLL
ncbi:MAG: ribosome maturation factor RimM [Bacilli bacterium]|jgi:16S rRNA processing protein RimM|nr:ribosome maturation factor RimM [Bacilli bacterium]MDY0063678.1 ribosome maturation factor RimM [Bacilli bacterium]